MPGRLHSLWGNVNISGKSQNVNTKHMSQIYYFVATTALLNILLLHRGSHSIERLWF